MKKILDCRRSIIALVGIGCLTWLGLAKGIDISGIALAISGIVASVSGANAWEKRSAQAAAPAKQEGNIN
jgi:hypothetical protein